ncbi:MAG: hypothetical protein IK118_10990 [Clostridia bacterium]|nr:hypothetical protein [Clostridia bacterium]
MSYKKIFIVAFSTVLLSAGTVSIFVVSAKKDTNSKRNSNTVFAAVSSNERIRGDAPDNEERKYSVEDLSPVTTKHVKEINASAAEAAYAPATEPPAEKAIVDETSSVVYAETTVFVTTPEESKQNAEYEAEVSRQAQEKIDSVIAQFGNRPLRDDIDVEKMLRSKITERQSDLECVAADYEEYKIASGIQTDPSFEEEIARIESAVLAQETILEDFLAGRISREEAHDRCMSAAFSAQFDMAE